MTEFDFDVVVAAGGENPKLVGNNVIECWRVPVTIVDGERVRDEAAREEWWVDIDGRPVVVEPKVEPEGVVVADEVSRWQKVLNWLGLGEE